MTADPEPGHLETLSRTIHRWGTVAALVVAIKALLSYGFASFAPLGLVQPPELNMFARLAHGIPAPASVQQWLQRYFQGETAFSEEWIRGALTISTSMLLLVCLVMVLRAVIVSREIGGGTPRLLFRYCVFFAVMGVISYPVFTTDFWLSIAWGRMLVAGQNPYYSDMSQAILEGLPISNWGERMTYGPLWEYFSAGLAWLAGGKEIVEFFLFKGVLAGAWLGTLLLLRKIAAESSTRDEAIAICLFGWMPMSYGFSIAEGHNDIAMVAPMVLWLYLLIRRQYHWSAPGLVASVLIKYVSAPLLAADLIAKRMLGKISCKKYLASMLPALLVGTLMMLSLAHDQGFFEPAARMRNWSFWTPGTALVELAADFGVTLSGAVAKLSVLAGCLGLTTFYFVRFVLSASFHRFISFSLTIILTVLFVIVGHVWPWFIIWGLPFAVLTWRSSLSWYFFCLAALAPFLNLHWLVGTTWELRPNTGLAYYFSALIATVWLYLHYRVLQPLVNATTVGARESERVL
jgi:hypothetical protein